MTQKINIINKISAKIIKEFKEFIEGEIFEGGQIGFLLVNQKVEDTIVNLSNTEILTVLIQNPDFLNSEIDDDFFDDEYLFKDKEDIVLTDLVKSHLKPVILFEVMDYLKSEGFYKSNKDGSIEIK